MKVTHFGVYFYSKMIVLKGLTIFSPNASRCWVLNLGKVLIILLELPSHQLHLQCIALPLKNDPQSTLHCQVFDTHAHWTFDESFSYNAAMVVTPLPGDIVLCKPRQKKETKFTLHPEPWVVLEVVGDHLVCFRLRHGRPVALADARDIYVAWSISLNILPNSAKLSLIGRLLSYLSNTVATQDPH